jgi:ABC-type xylose transport system permease subunit
MMVGFHVPWVDIDVKLPQRLVIPLSLILGGVIGASQRLFHRLQQDPAFIATLAGMLIFRGSPETCCRASSSDRSPRGSSRQRRFIGL